VHIFRDKGGGTISNPSFKQFFNLFDFLTGGFGFAKLPHFSVKPCLHACTHNVRFVVFYKDGDGNPRIEENEEKG
jgi:hypothetical protein